jgi:hypothetical protein
MDTVNTRLGYNCQGDGRRSGSRERKVPTSRAKTTHQYRNATSVVFARNMPSHLAQFVGHQTDKLARNRF